MDISIYALKKICIYQVITLYLCLINEKIMTAGKRKLIISQLDKKIKMFKSVQQSLITPSQGWIYAIRKALNMSLKQLAKKLNVSSQNINQLETREKNGTITLNKLREASAAMDMKLVYAIIPQEESLEKIIEKRANKIAKEIVLRTSHSMSLEDQENLPERIENAIKEKAEQIKNELPRYLWD